VEFAGRRFYDAGVSESIPYRTALAQGATHVLVLRSRRDPLTWPDGRAPSRSVRVITRTTLRRETPALRATFLARDARLAADDRRLAAYQSASAPPVPASNGTATASDGNAPASDGNAPASGGTAPASGGTAPASGGTAPASDADAPISAQPAVFSIRPAADSPEVSRLATDGKLLLAAFDAGRAAIRAAFA
jgi:hypothetical protein